MRISDWSSDVCSSDLASRRFADFLRDHAAYLRAMQWIIVVFYVLLLVVPAILPLPDRTASVFNNLTVFAQFAFWGVWWPFVLLRSEEHTSELQSLMRISYAVFCLTKTNNYQLTTA